MSRPLLVPTEPSTSGALGVRRRGEWLRSVFSFAVLLVVTVVIVAVALAVGWWLFSVLVNPLPYSDPEAIGPAALR